MANGLANDAVMSSYNTDISEELVHFKGQYIVTDKAIQTCLFTLLLSRSGILFSLSFWSTFKKCRVGFLNVDKAFLVAPYLKPLVPL